MIEMCPLFHVAQNHFAISLLCVCAGYAISEMGRESKEVKLLPDAEVRN